MWNTLNCSCMFWVFYLILLATICWNWAAKTTHAYWLPDVCVALKHHLFGNYGACHVLINPSTASIRHKKSGNQDFLNSLAYVQASKVILTRKEKEGLVIKLAEEGKTTRDIAQVAHVSLKDIGTIFRKYTGEEDGYPYREKGLSTCSRAFKLFKEVKSLVDTAIALDIDTDEVLGMYFDYLRLLNLQKLMTLYWELGDEDFSLLDILRPAKVGGPCNQKGHSQDYRGGRGT